MLKILGSLLIIGATTWAGFEAARHISGRPKQLRLFRNSLQTLDAEIMYSHTPLKKAAERIAAQMPKPVSTFYASFAAKLSAGNLSVKEAWQESLYEIWKTADLKKSELEILLQFGENLGKHDRHTQQKQILLTLTHLEREEIDAREKQKQYEKLAKSFGFLSGLLFILLLL